MLSKPQRVYQLDRRTSSISSDRLPEADLPHLGRAVGVYRRLLGERLGRVRDAARVALEGLRPDRVEAVIEVLDAVATYEWPRGRAQGDRRVEAFTRAAAGHPCLDPAAAREVLAAVFGLAPDDLAERVALLYADYPEFHRLRDFPADYGAEEARADYDLGQAQALLYSATRIAVEGREDFKHIVQYARLARLLVRITPLADGGYRFVFDGPNSVLRQTHAYGVDFARFLAALVRARDWRLEAEIVLRRGWPPLRFALTDADGLLSRVPPPALFDSALEAALAARFGQTRDGWRLLREGAVFTAGDRVVVPDFLFVHDDGTRVALEIVGYWTPEYLRAKLRKLGRVTAPNLLIAAPRRLGLAPGALPRDVLPFGRRILLRHLLPRLEAFRRGDARAR